MLQIKRLNRYLAWVTMILFVDTIPVLAADMKTLPAHVPELVSHLAPQGRLKATNTIQLAIGLPLHNVLALENFLAQVYDPTSPRFRQFLTQAEFTARFGPTEMDYVLVKNYVQSNGLAVTTTYGNRLVLDVVGPVAAVEKAFHLTLRTYRHPTERRYFFAPDAEPKVDTALPIVDIEGLSDYWRPQCRLRRPVWSTSRQPKSGSAPDGSGSYFGDDFRNAYVPGTTLTGAGQSVGLLEFDGYYSNDIAAYAIAAGNGRTNIAIQTVLLDHDNGVPTSGINSGNAEVSLDIEMAMAMAPGLAAIVVFEAGPAGNQNNLLNAMLSYSGTVKNLSCSWGWGGGPSATTDNIFTNMAAVGQSFFNASGDSDAFTAGTNSINGVDNPDLDNAPSSSPMITQVGGTTLTMSGNGAAYTSEATWNRGLEHAPADDGEGSSGGISSYYSIPSWQTNINNLIGAGGSPVFRNTPDVAMTAEDVYVIAGGGGSSGGYGGTSCAAPLWAGFLALVNQQAAASGLPSVGFINPAIYFIADGPNYANCFHDITTGNNTWSGSPNFFHATNGYDLCTGLGTPNGTNLVNSLAGSNPLMVSTLSGAASGLAGGPFVILSGNFLLGNDGNFPLDWSLVSTSKWLTISATNGTLVAGAQTNLLPAITGMADSLPAGNYTSDLIFSNLTFQLSQNGTFSLKVGQPLVISHDTGFSADGMTGGPFDVNSQNYSLTNLGINSLAWSTINTSLWLVVMPSDGILPGGGQTNLTVSLSAEANLLAPGNYKASVLVANPAGDVASLPFSLNVRQTVVNNGGFETGNFYGWTLDGSSAFNIVTTSSVFVHSGDYGAALAQYGSLGYLSQTLATTPGQNYLLSFWLENPPNPAGASPNQFSVVWNGTVIFNGTNLPFMSWTNLQFIVPASEAGTVLQFGFEDTPYYLGLDDIIVIPITPPEFVLEQAKSQVFNVAWQAVPGLVYQLQYIDNLCQTNWTNLGARVTASSNTVAFTDTNAIILSKRFYRVVVLP